MSTKSTNKNNIKLYTIYKMFSWDLLFYYSIIYLFLTIEKNLSPSSVLLSNAFLQLFQLIFQFPCVIFSDLLDNRKSLIIANICTSISILILILSSNFTIIIISNLFLAIGFNFKNLCESSILYDSIKKHRKKNYLFSKIDSISSSYYYFFDAISAIFTGFLFVINSYIPMILCFVFCSISIILSLNFEENSKNHLENKLSNKEKINNMHRYFKELKRILYFIVQSNRLKSLLLFSGIFTGILTLTTSLRSILLTQIYLKEEYFGVAFAIIQFIAAISSKQTTFIQNRLKNKALTFFAFSNCFPLIIIGLCMLCKLPLKIITFSISIWLILYAITKGPFHTLIKRYLHSFVTPTINTKIYAIQTIINSICTICISFLTSLLLKHTSPSLTIISLGFIFLLVFVALLEFMKTRVGLKPEEYKKSELTYVELK